MNDKTDKRQDMPAEICSICGGPIEVHGDWRYGNNAEPVNSGRCCDDCNQTVVIPTRLRPLLRQAH